MKIHLQILTICLACLVPMLMFGQDIPEGETDDPEVVESAIDWDNIDLTSPRMKPDVSAIPWWVYAGGGAALTGAGILILTDGDDDPDDLEAIDIQVQIDCGREGQIDPLINDLGEDLTLESFEAPTDLVTQSGNLLIVSADARENFTITYTVSDADGETDQGTVFVRILLTQIDIPDISYELNQGENLSTNVFDYFDCTDCELMSVSSGEGVASLDYSPDGPVDITFEEGYSGTVNLLYTIHFEDDCTAESTANLTIEVLPPGEPPVANDVEVTVTCGEGGSVFPLENDEGDGLSLDGFEVDNNWVEQDGDELIISPDAYESFEIQYTVVNAGGLSDEATVFVTVIVPPIEVEDIELTAQAGESVGLVVFDFFDCEDCEVVDWDFDPAIGSVSFDSDGSIDIDVSEDFTGVATLIFTVLSPCMAEESGRIIIEVAESDCEILSGLLTVVDASCGLSDGALYFDASGLERTYEFLLDGEEVGDSVGNLAGGDYVFSVVDTEDDACSENFPAEIEDVFDIDFSAEAVPATCIESGDLNFEIDPGNYNLDGQLQIQVVGEGFDLVADVTSTSFSLSDLVDDVDLQETAEVTIWFEGNEEDCSFEESYEIPVEDLPFELEDYTVETYLGEEATFNYLEVAAEGTGMSVVDFEGGDKQEVDVDEAGNVSYTILEEEDFTVTVTVRDTCGVEKTATIEFILDDAPCVDYDVEFDVGPANCGLEDGFAIADVSPENEDLEFLWSTDETENFILDAAPGTYELVITDTGTGCVDSFSVEIPEWEDGDYLQSYDIDPGNCVDELVLEVLLENLKSSELIVLAERPDGILFDALVPVGTMDLNDIFDLTPGQWVFTFIDPDDVDENCFQEVVINIPEPDLPELEVVDVIAPSQPDAQDGSIAINISGGEPPYVVFVNDEAFEFTAEGEYEIPDLSPGEYEIQLVDDLGCESDAITVVLEADDTDDFFLSPLKVGVGQNFPGSLSDGSRGIPELPFSSDAYVIQDRSTAFYLAWDIADSPFEVVLGYARFSGYFVDPAISEQMRVGGNSINPAINFSMDSLLPFSGLQLSSGWRRDVIALPDGGNSQGLQFQSSQQFFPTGLNWDYQPTDRFSIRAFGQILLLDDFSGMDGFEYGLNLQYSF